MKTPAVDPSYWTVRPRFGVAGGPDEVVLTEAGRLKAFSVGAQCRPGAYTKALRDLWQNQGFAYRSVHVGSGRLEPTEFGREQSEMTWGYLRSLGYVESVYNDGMAPRDEGMDAIRLTEAGKKAAWNGVEEGNRLLDRARRSYEENK